MKFDLNQHPEADDELTAAHDYYLKVGGSDLSDRFSDRIESAVDFVFQWPHAFPRFPIEYAPVTVRTYGLEEFPFSIVYAVGESEIFVLAYAHEKRKPGYWKHRLER